MGNTVITRPVEIADPLVNPDCGWGIWMGPVDPGMDKGYSIADMTTGFGDDAPLFSFACIDWYWRYLEPQEGEFHWDDLDAVVNYWLARGKQINLRLWTTYDPGWDAKGGAPVAPDWLFDEAGCRYFELEYPLKGPPVGTLRAPDYADPVYLEKFRNFLAAAKEHYEPQPSFHFIGWQTASYGPWGEWYEGEEGTGKYDWSNDEIEHDTCVTIQNVFKKLFGTKCQMSIRGDEVPAEFDYELWKYKSAMKEATANGWVIGRHGTWLGDTPWIARRVRLLEEFWPSNVHYGESNWSYMSMIHEARQGDLDDNLDGAVGMHYNWVHQYMTGEDYRKYPNTAYFERGLKAGGLGYRFVLLEAEHPEQIAPGSAFVLRQKWANRNAGRGWRRYPLAVYLSDPSSGRVAAGPLVDEDFDQTMWLAGQTYDVSSKFTVPADVQPGTYDLLIAMVDQCGEPRIRLAVEGGDAENRYKIGTVRVDASSR